MNLAIIGTGYVGLVTGTCFAEGGHRVICVDCEERKLQMLAAMREIYAPYGAPVIVTGINSAELIQHAANSFLALTISSVNAVSVICEASGANVPEPGNGIGMDSRIDREFPDAPLVFGGSCLSKHRTLTARAA